MQRTLSQTWREIRITKKKILNRLPPPGAEAIFVGHTRKRDECQDVGELLEQIEDARRAGVRAILVTLHDFEGGDAEAGDALYYALRRFSRAGGRSIAHVRGFAASSGAHFSLGCDFLFMDPGALIHIHSAICTGSDAAEAERRRLAINAGMKAVAVERTGVTPEIMDDLLSHRYDPIKDTFMVGTWTPSGAAEHRWSDGTLSLEQARVLAERLASGEDLATARTLMLRQRAAGAALASIDGGKITTGYIAAARIDPNAFQTSNYAQDGNGYPTAGARLDAQGTALKVAPANLQIGSTTIKDTWFGRSRMVALHSLAWTGSAFAASQGDPGSGYSLSWDSTNKRLTVIYTGWANLGFNQIQLVGATRKISAGNTTNPRLFVSVYSSGVSGSDLTITLECRTWHMDINGLPTSTSDVADWSTTSAVYNLTLFAYTSSGWTW